MPLSGVKATSKDHGKVNEYAVLVGSGDHSGVYVPSACPSHEFAGNTG